MFSCAAYAQVLNNPNRLPSCPPDVNTRWHNCWGTQNFQDGEKYVGEYKDSKPHGQGVSISADGKKYIGEYKEGKLSGAGTWTSANGDTYVGEYKDGNKNGKGTYTWANGDKYFGEFKDDMANGRGTHTSSNGSSYTGEWKDGDKNGKGTYTWANGDKYVGEYKDGKQNGKGTHTSSNGGSYTGEWKDGKQNGQGKAISSKGENFDGEFKDGKIHGQGIWIAVDGKRFEGIWENGQFIREAKVNLPNLNNKLATNTDRTDIDRERQQLAEERRRLEEEKRQREQAKLSQRINLQASITTPTNDGEYTISIQTNADTASLKINGEEIGGSAGGSYAINRIASAGQDTKLDIIARDVYGNTDSKTIIVSRPVVESKASYASLNPVQVKRQPNRDAVAIIIGISNYKTLPKVEFANDDARIFYDYAIRALGVKPENIKLLVDSDAEEVEIIKAFKTWLPSRVKSTTDVYVYYSGHGLPTADGQGLYLLPPRADRDFISRTAIQFQEINADLQAAKPRSVTIFMDACYSGQTRSGETLIANARPVALKAEKKLFPDSFTVISASQADQIASSSPDLKHGIFSYYLMKGMEGDADTNKDGKITLGEMQAYLVENVGRQAGMMSRKQEPQLIGDVGRVLVGR